MVRSVIFLECHVPDLFHDRCYHDLSTPRHTITTTRKAHDTGGQTRYAVFRVLQNFDGDAVHD